jgi:hypothetical protein
VVARSWHPASRCLWDEAGCCMYSRHGCRFLQTGWTLTASHLLTPPRVALAGHVCHQRTDTATVTRIMIGCSGLPAGGSRMLPPTPVQLRAAWMGSLAHALALAWRGQQHQLAGKHFRSDGGTAICMRIVWGQNLRCQGAAAMHILYGLLFVTAICQHLLQEQH